MRFAAVILFTGIYLFSFTEVHEVFRLPYLLKHYQEHAQANGSVDIFGFLLAHYGDVSHQGQHDHHDLPFNPGHCSHSGLTAPVSLPDVFETQFSVHSEVLSHGSEIYLSFAHTEYHYAIWQPPRA